MEPGDRSLPAEAVDRLHQLAIALLPATGYDLVAAMKRAVEELENLNEVLAAEGIPRGDSQVIKLRHLTDREDDPRVIWVLAPKKMVVPKE